MRGTINRRAFGAFAMLGVCLGVAAFPLQALADTWPSREITLINNFPPGAATDLTARAIARSIEKQLGATVVVKNVPGGAGQLGPAELASSKPDGYTMGLVGSSTYLTAPHMMDVPFKAWDAFSPIAQATELRYGLAVPTTSPIKTLDEFVAAAKQKRLTYSSTSPNNVVAMFQLAKQTGANLRWVVFAGGNESVLQAVGGHVDAVLQSATEMKPQIDAGKLRLLASASPERWAEYPDVKTMKELGYNASSPGPMAYAFPAGTDPKIRDRMQEAFKVALEDPEVVKQIKAIGIVPAYRSGPEFTAYMKEMEAPLLEVLIDSGMKKK